jgi:hypothetical protein
MTEMTTPVPSSQGTYAVYETPDGGLVLVYNDGNGEKQMSFPAAVVNMGKSFAEGNMNPMSMLKSMMPGKKNGNGA